MHARFRNYFKPDKEKTEFKVYESISKTLSIFEGGLKIPLIEVYVIAKDDPVINSYQNEFAQVILNILVNARDIFIEEQSANH
jgi:signal transduction histidine kinase